MLLSWNEDITDKNHARRNTGQQAPKKRWYCDSRIIGHDDNSFSRQVLIREPCGWSFLVMYLAECRYPRLCNVILLFKWGEMPRRQGFYSSMIRESLIYHLSLSQTSKTGVINQEDTVARETCRFSYISHEAQSAYTIWTKALISTRVQAKMAPILIIEVVFEHDDLPTLPRWHLTILLAMFGNWRRCQHVQYTSNGGTTELHRSEGGMKWIDGSKVETVWQDLDVSIATSFSAMRHGRYQPVVMQPRRLPV